MLSLSYLDSLDNLALTNARSNFLHQQEINHVVVEMNQYMETYFGLAN